MAEKSIKELSEELAELQRKLAGLEGVLNQVEELCGQVIAAAELKVKKNASPLDRLTAIKAALLAVKTKIPQELREIVRPKLTLTEYQMLHPNDRSEFRSKHGILLDDPAKPA